MVERYKTMTLENKIQKHGPQTFKVGSEKHTIEGTGKGYHYRGCTFRVRGGKWYIRRKGKGGFDKSAATSDLATAVKFTDGLLLTFGADKGEAKIKALQALESARHGVRTVLEFFKLYWNLTERSTRDKVLKDFLSVSYTGQHNKAYPIKVGSVAGAAGKKAIEIDDSGKDVIITSGHDFVNAILNQPIEDAWNSEVVSTYKSFSKKLAKKTGKPKSQEYERVLSTAGAKCARAKSLFNKALLNGGENDVETYRVSERERTAIESANRVTTPTSKLAVHYVPPVDGKHGQIVWDNTIQAILPLADSRLPWERNIFRSCLLGVNGALRPSEIEEMKHNQINGQRASWNPAERKNNKAHTIELSAWSASQIARLKDVKYVDNGVRIEDVMRESGYERTAVQTVIKAHGRFEQGLDLTLGESVNAWCNYGDKAYDKIVAAVEETGFQWTGLRHKPDGTENDGYVLEGSTWQRGVGNWKRVNEFLLDLGWADPNGGNKVFYRLRKHLGSVIYSTMGVEAAAKLLGNTIAVCERHYSTYFDTIKNDWLENLPTLHKTDKVIDVIDQIIAA